MDRNLPLRKIAALLDIDTSYYSKIERGEREASKMQIHQLEVFFGVKKNYLMILYLSEKIYLELHEEECAKQVLKVAESWFNYKRILNKGF
ncbi:MAG: helix-turn-helix transcriptional regulator [Saprospiraceae bacterium]|nr:helix-turn-helix transcriptional regulator [Saprospiraceae bacterium]